MKNKAVPHNRTTQSYHTSYHTVVPHSRTIQSYHTVVPHVVPHSRNSCKIQLENRRKRASGFTLGFHGFCVGQLFSFSCYVI